MVGYPVTIKGHVIDWALKGLWLKSLINSSEFMLRYKNYETKRMLSEHLYYDYVFILALSYMYNSRLSYILISVFSNINLDQR
jgi:hypothetical protein